MTEQTSDVEFAHKIHEQGHHHLAEGDRSSRWVELAEAIVLAIVAVATAWSGYQATKFALAQQEWKYVQNYADAKTAVIEEIIARAGVYRKEPNQRANSWVGVLVQLIGGLSRLIPCVRERCSSGTDCWDLLPTRRPVAATTEEAGQAEQVAEVVPSTVVVDLVDTEVAFEQRGHKHERRNKALPEPQPEARDHVVFAHRSFGLVRSRSTSSQNDQQQQDKQSQRGFHRDCSLAYSYEAWA
jgi:hypothetical protein